MDKENTKKERESDKGEMYKPKLIPEADFRKIEKEFKGLDNYEAKLNWWGESKLRKEYFKFTYDSIGNSPNEPFKISIYPNNANEREQYFEWFNRTHPQFSFKSWREKFEQKINQSKNKERTLEEERIKIKNMILWIERDHKKHPSQKAIHYTLIIGEFEGFRSQVESRDINFAKEGLFGVSNIYHIMKGLMAGIRLFEQEGYLRTYNLEEDEARNKHFHALHSKLNWNGDKGILIDIFYQLKKISNSKGEYLIPNSNDEVANFLKFNFECFSDTKLSTISGQLKTTKRPKKSEKLITIECEK